MKRASATWEYRKLDFPRGTSREATRSLLTEFAENDRWELDHLRLFRDGRRTVVLRRKVYRVARTA